MDLWYRVTDKCTWYTRHNNMTYKNVLHWWNADTIFDSKECADMRRATMLEF